MKKAKFKFVARDDVTLADALLGNGAARRERGPGPNGGDMPHYMEELLSDLFAVANRSGSGNLSTLELMSMLKKRAKGTALDGDAHAIFSLRTLLATQASQSRLDLHKRADSLIGEREFKRGIIAAISKDPNGHVAQWLLKELQDEAALWSELEDEGGRTYYVKQRAIDEKECASQWERPDAFVGVERFSQL